MRHFLTTTAFVLLAGAANATTLTFDDVTCDGGNDCGNHGVVDQIADGSYGDETGVDVTFEGFNSGSPDDIKFWEDRYSGLTSVIWTGSSDATSQIFITFEALAGYEVTLDSFQLGAYPNSDKNTDVQITELGSGNILLDAPGLVIDGQTPSTFDDGWSSTSGIVLSFGFSAYNVGIDNISFSVEPVMPQPVPLPAGLPLIASGALLMGLIARRKA